MRTENPSLKLAVLLMTTSSFLVPAVGLVTAPLLARALSPDGRGELAAAMGPATLMLAVATFGLPEALTYRLAGRPQDTRGALRGAVAMTLAGGTATVAAIWLSVQYLSAGDPRLAHLMLLAAVVTLPCLLVNVLRGAASGNQQWPRVALERVIVTVWRLVWYVSLYVTGNLTIRSALLVIVSAPFAGILAYATGIRPPNAKEGRQDDLASETRPQVVRPLLGFGARVWFGSIAQMLLARVGQLFMVPLSSTRDLGLFTVAITIADVPLLVAFAVQSAVFGVNSKNHDASQIALTSRLTLLVGAVGCGAMALILPFTIGPLFGPEFADALVPTLLLILGALISIPGLMAASGLAAWGRPGLRSAGLAVSLVGNVGAFFVLVPPLGVYGACWAGLVSTVVMDVFMIRGGSRAMGVPASDFWLIKRTDVRHLAREAAAPLRRLRTRYSAHARRGQ